MRREGSTEEESIKDSKWKEEMSATKGGLGFSYKGEARFKSKDGIDLNVIGSKYVRMPPTSRPDRESPTPPLQSTSECWTKIERISTFVCDSTGFKWNENFDYDSFFWNAYAFNVCQS